MKKRDTNLANCFHSVGQYNKAVNYHETALNIAKQIGDKAGEGRAYRNLGSFYCAVGQYRNALSHFEMSLFIAKQIKNKFR